MAFWLASEKKTLPAASTATPKGELIPKSIKVVRALFAAVHFLDGVIFRISEVNIAGTVHGDTEREIQSRPISVMTVWLAAVHFLTVLGAVVRKINIPRSIHRYAKGRCQSCVHQRGDETVGSRPLLMALFEVSAT